MNNWIICSWIICTVLLSNMVLSAAYTYEAVCAKHELLSCGAIDKSWEMCEPRTANVRSIVSVHLDIRYDTRNCRKYGTPHNFGLTRNGRSVWTVNACYGSFLLCLDIDSSRNNNTAQTADQNSNMNHIRGKYFHSDYKASSLPDGDTDNNSDGDLEVDDDPDVDDDTDIDDVTYTDDITNADDLYTGVVSDVGDNKDADTAYGADDDVFERETLTVSPVTKLDDVIYDNDTVTLSVIRNSSVVASTDVKVEFLKNEETRFISIKYLIMGSIIAGGVIIVGLIAIMAYLCSCTDSQDDDYGQKPQQANYPGTKYFRQKKWSTAPLMADGGRLGSMTSSNIPSSPTSIRDDYKDVYDFIPADLHCNNNNTEDKTTPELQQKQPTLHIVDEIENVNSKHDYFVLASECGINAPKIDTNNRVSTFLIRKASVTSCSHSEQNESGENNGTPVKHDYFVLVPEQTTDNTMVTWSADVENEYDHLIHTPKPSVSDSSNYNHIDIQHGTCTVDGQSVES